MHDRAERRPDRDGVRFRDRMGDRDEGEPKRAERDLAAERYHLEFHTVFERGFLELAAQQSCGEWSRVDRTTESRPEVGNRAQVVLMPVSEHEAGQAPALCLEEPHVGHHQIDAGGRGFAAEEHAAIDDDPRTGVGRTVAVAVEVHADLARSAQGQEDQIVLGFPVLSHGPRAITRLSDLQLAAFDFVLLRAWISMSPLIVRSGSTWSMTAT